MNLEKLNEQGVHRFSHEQLSLYFEKQDMNMRSRHMEERTTWIGTGELYGNLMEAGAAPPAELAEYEGTFMRMDKSLSFVPFTRLREWYTGRFKPFRTITCWRIKTSAFPPCTRLAGALTIQDNVTTIDSYAFYNCSGLKPLLVKNHPTKGL